MIIDLSALSPGAQVLVVDEEVAFEDVDGSKNRISCHIELNVRNTDEAVYIHAVLTGVLRTSCHMCLEPADHRVEPVFDIVVKRLSAGAYAQPTAEDDDLLYVHSDDKQISLDAQVYENLIASIPIRILCRDDCKGLCPGCGVNLNLDACRCAKNEDPR
jgi:uncharacterized protein